MTAQPIQNDFYDANEALARLRLERTEVRAELERLKLRDDALIRQEEKLILERQRREVERLGLVRRGFLLTYLDISGQGFDRLMNNPAKRAPQPVTGLDGVKRWRLSDWDEWIGRSLNDARGAVKRGR